MGTVGTILMVFLPLRGDGETLPRGGVQRTRRILSVSSGVS